MVRDIRLWNDRSDCNYCRAIKIDIFLKKKTDTKLSSSDKMLEIKQNLLPSMK